MVRDKLFFIVLTRVIALRFVSRSCDFKSFCALPCLQYWYQSLHISEKNVVDFFFLFPLSYFHSSPCILSDPGGLLLLSPMKIFYSDRIIQLSGFPFKRSTWGDFGSLNFFSRNATVYIIIRICRKYTFIIMQLKILKFLSFERFNHCKHFCSIIGFIDFLNFLICLFFSDGNHFLHWFFSKLYFSLPWDIWSSVHH